MLYQHAELLPILVFRLVQISVQSSILSTFVSECPNGNTDFCRAGFQYSLFQKSSSGCLLLDLSQSHCSWFWKGTACSSVFFSLPLAKGSMVLLTTHPWQKECRSEVSRYCAEWLNKISWKKINLTALGSRLLQEQRRDAKIILVHLATLLSFHRPQLPQHEDKRAPGSLRWAGWCPLAQPPQPTALTGPLGICCLPRVCSKGKWVGRMGVKLAEQPRGSGPRFCQSALLQTFVASQWEHFKTLELTPQATTAERSAYLFIYCYLLTENESVSTLFKWCVGGWVCVTKNYSLPCAVEGAIFPPGEERSRLNRGTAQQRHPLLQAVSITSWPFFKTCESVLVLKKMRSK